MRSRVRLLTYALAAMAASTDLDAQTMSPASAGGPSVVGGAGGCRCGTTVRFATLSITDRQDGNTLSNGSLLELSARDSIKSPSGRTRRNSDVHWIADLSLIVEAGGLNPGRLLLLSLDCYALQEHRKRI